MSMRAGGVRDPGREALLLCGVALSLYYVAMNVYVPTRWDGYSHLSQVVSELSAIDAPTRALWVRLGFVYTLLLLAFGVGVWLSAGGSRALRVVGALLIANAALGPFWPPMHMRGAEATLTDVLHVAWGGLWLLTMLLAMGLSAWALGSRFRIYTVVTAVVFVVFGTLTSRGGMDLAANLPTPWIGLWERIDIAAGMLWLAVLSVALLRRPQAKPNSGGKANATTAAHAAST